MTRYLIGSALGALLLLAAGAARAESEAWPKLYDVEGDPSVGKAEVGGVAKQCNFHMMSRMGPDPREVAACDAAVKRLAARGPSAVPAIFAALDRDTTPHAARVRLYGALAETRDPAVAGKMIDAMAKIATSRDSRRQYESGHMEDVAQAILHADPEERAPWVEEVERTDEFARLTERVFAWRGHQRATAGKTSDELATARLARARADAASPDLEKAFLAVRYLAQREPAEARAAAEALIGRSGEAPAERRDAVRRSFEMLKRQAEYQERQRAEEAAARARVPAKGKAAPKSPPTGKKAPAKSDPASRS